MKLEVKVNDGGFLIDATMELKDGVMIVTPVKALSKEEEGKWKPKVGEEFYYPSYLDGERFEVGVYTCETQKILDEDPDVKKGWCFRNERECQAFCDKLNAAIDNVKSQEIC